MKRILITAGAIFVTLLINTNRINAQYMEPKLTDDAKRNLEELFPDHASTLNTTDPELAEIFCNFAFDETLQYGELDTRTRVMAILASTIASQTLTSYKIMLAVALDTGITPVEVKEIVYQAVPYLGMSKVIDFIQATNDILTARGIMLPLEGQSATTRETRFAKGLAVQKEIFGDERIDGMYRDAPANQMHIQHYLSGNCFGDFVARGGLDISTREMLTFSMLLSLGGCEAQLKGHIQGNVNVGNDKGFLLAVVTQLIPYVGYPRALNAIACLNEVIPE